jgi:tetratricopeptide (TPR) repeat protein
MRLIFRRGIFGGLILLAAVMLTPRLLSLLRINLADLAAKQYLAASDNHYSFWDACFGSAFSNGRPAGSTLDRPLSTATPPEIAADGRRLLWKFLAEPARVGPQDIQFDQSTPFDTMFAQLIAGCAALQRQQIQNATAYFARLPPLARGLARLGDDEELAGHLDVAQNAWKIASQIDQATADIHYGYASFLRRHGGAPGDVLPELQEAVRLSPGNWIYRTALGEVYQEQGQSVQAIQIYSEALSLAPDQGSVYFQRGLAYGAMGELPEACADIQRAIALDTARRETYTQTLCTLCAQLELCQQK